MADLSITATSVVTTSANQTTGTAGEAVTAGQAIYKKNADGFYYKSQADGSAEEATFAGIALNGAAAGQPLVFQTSGDITIGATVVVGKTYVISATAGGIAPDADLVSTNRKTILGYGKTASVLTIAPVPTGVQIP